MLMLKVAVFVVAVALLVWGVFTAAQLIGWGW